MGIKLNISDDAKRNLALTGFSSQYGARQIAGVIRTQLTRPISKKIVAEEIKTGQEIFVEWNENTNNIDWKIT
jgi:ATP-dependent Clp protease ATP-binding subunit ClpA